MGSLICPPTRTACWTGGGGASGSPPTTPPTTPPGTPPSTPPETPPSTPRSRPSSGRISSGTSTGATNWFCWETTLGATFGARVARAAGGGGGGGGAGADSGSAKNAFTPPVGSGNCPADISGTSTIRAAATRWITSDTGTVVDCRVRCFTLSESIRSSNSLFSIRPPHPLHFSPEISPRRQESPV
ncbi:MAG: hypothetical protein EHM91_01465 [Planctomycetota bacterium]|nr:MAG: hypothetical protein EHM91_01465 [Planctomycetota bacterium]